MKETDPAIFDHILTEDSRSIICEKYLFWYSIYKVHRRNDKADSRCRSQKTRISKVQSNRLTN